MLKSLIPILIISTLALSINSVPTTEFLKNLSKTKGNHWAVLVAGSNSYWNYRHQSDILHSYHILVNNGVKKENIITFAYDDIAKARQNPFPGKVFNKPDPKGKGKDVYEGVPLDYTGKTVTPKNFLNVIKGNKSAMTKIGSGRVLESTSNDHVFIYFADHGATGLIAFPSEYLYADDLNNALKYMHDQKMFSKLVFYLEACESGSMFDKELPTDIKIYATTAANPNQSSYAIYCGPDDKINGKSIGSCLGDEYSVNWMEDSDNDKGLDETLQTQFEHVKSKTKDSQVQEYGDMSFVKEEIGEYQGNTNESELNKFIKMMKSYYEKLYREIFGDDDNNENKNSNTETESEEYKLYLQQAKESVMNSRETKLRYLYDRMLKMNDLESQDEYRSEIQLMLKVDNTFKQFNDYFKIDNGMVVKKKINFDCLKKGVEAYEKNCQSGEYSLKYVKNIALVCEAGESTSEIVNAFEKICKA